jgi:hypothetical protein
MNTNFSAIWGGKPYSLEIKPVDILTKSVTTSLSYRVAVINRSKSVGDDDVRALKDALQAQVHHYLAPAWGIDAQLTFVGSGESPAKESWWLEIGDTTDNAGMMSYHSVTEEGLPRARIFAATSKESGLPWTLNASHELLELLVDPRANLTVLHDQARGTKRRFYMYEICDPVSSLDSAYRIPISGNEIVVSDFVFPSWFGTANSSHQGDRFDQQSRIHAPFKIAPNGYASVFDGGQWHQIFQ